MKNEFVLAFNEVIEEKQLPKDVILAALESAMISAYQKSVNASKAQHVESKIDPDTGKVTIYAEKEIVEEVLDAKTEVNLEEAKKYDPNAVLGGMVIVESTPKDFGRVAAQTARQVIQQKIRDAERSAQLQHYEKQLGEIISGIVQAINSQGIQIGLELRAEGTMPRKEMIPGERFRMHERVRALVAEVKESPRGPQIILSRTHRDFLRRLLENEVPEIYHGVVEIRSIAREPGQRAKVAVSATQSGIDPVGACVGIRGVRIQAIVRELHDEKIDVIEWNPDPAAFINKAISPARVVGVYLNETVQDGKTATVVVPEDQLSLAIGRDGQNARLAAKLTNWRIDIKSLTEGAADSLVKLQNNPELVTALKISDEIIQQIESLVARKSEGRPLNPEEYDQMAKFVDQVEKQIATRYKPVVEKVFEPAPSVDRAGIPEFAFSTNILDSGLDEHINIILQEAGYHTLGDLALQVRKNPDEILKLQGIGPKSMEKIFNHINQLLAPTLIEAEALPEEEIATGPDTDVLPVIEMAGISDTGITIEPSETIHAVSDEVTEGLPENISDVEGAEIVSIELEVASENQVEQRPADEEDIPFEKLFELKSDMVQKYLDEPDEEEESEDEDSETKKTGKKKKKRKNVEYEYDPEKDVMLIHKKRKRDGLGVEFDWEE
jgi:transcription termination/antitermination protein NusA